MFRRLISFCLVFPLAGCGGEVAVVPADLILTNANIYTLNWPDPDGEGRPSSKAPYRGGQWHADAQALAIAAGEITAVGSEEDVIRQRSANTRVIDLQGAAVLPGLVDSHVHLAGLGESLERINLVGVESEEEVVRRVAERVADTPSGEWIIGWGWDEGAWADRYPRSERLSRAAPDNPVSLQGLHGFAVWCNRAALEMAGITAATPDPPGGQILRDPNGRPTGVLLNRARAMVEAAAPKPTLEQRVGQIQRALQQMARDGYVAVHEAGADTHAIEALERLEAEGRLPIRVRVMLNGRSEVLLNRWLQRGPESPSAAMLTVNGVKAYYDGALGSRGALLLDDYSDRPGHRGVAGAEYGFDRDQMIRMASAGFQLAIHAIGDAGNRATLDFFEELYRQQPQARSLRHRIEHAQVVHPDDFSRFADLELTASMEPAHAVEDKTWAEDRLGPRRVRHAYAWRAFRRAGVELILNSDLPGSDHDVFYGLHAAVTRRDRELQPEGGWLPEQSLTIEEALRGYTLWPARSSGLGERTGALKPGNWADLTVFDSDPFELAVRAPELLLQTSIRMTIVRGAIAFDSNQSR